MIPKIFKQLIFALLAGFAAGCAGSDEKSPETKAPPVLTGTSWWAEDIANRGVIDNSHTTIEFHADGRVSGDTGCNQYTGSVTIQGDELRFGLLATTMRACPEALMDQERKFLEATKQVRTFEIAETGLLYLRDETGKTMLRLSRIEE
jgi:putative lipoprotein